MKLRYYEDIAYRTRGGKFVRFNPGDSGKTFDTISAFRGKWVHGDVADAKARAKEGGGSEGAKVVK